MKQGDATTCKRCSAEGHVWQTFTPAYNPHPVILSWERGGRSRHFILSSAHELTDVCCWCELSPLEGAREISEPKGPHHPVDKLPDLERKRSQPERPVHGDGPLASSAPLPTTMPPAPPQLALF